MSTFDQDKLVREFCNNTGASDRLARDVLTRNKWDLPSSYKEAERMCMSSGRQLSNPQGGPPPYSEHATFPRNSSRGGIEVGVGPAVTLDTKGPGPAHAQPQPQPQFQPALDRLAGGAQDDIVPDGELSPTPAARRCGVCMERYRSHVITPCLHSICGPCGQTLLETSKHCHMCRAKFSKRQLKQLY